MSKTVKGPASNTKKIKNRGSTSTDKNEIEECGVCKKQVGDEDQGLECEVCKKWWHSGCVDIEDSEYEIDIAKEPFTGIAHHVMAKHFR